MEAELRNFQATVYSLCGSGLAQFQSFKSHTILYAEAEAELRNFNSQYIPCAKAELRKFKPKNIPCAEVELQNFKSNIVCVRKRNFKSHNILYMESLWFLMQQPEVPGSAGPKAPVSKPSWRCCSQLCHLGGGPYWDIFSLLRSY